MNNFKIYKKAIKLLIILAVLALPVNNSLAIGDTFSASSDAQPNLEQIYFLPEPQPVEQTAVIATEQEEVVLPEETVSPQTIEPSVVSTEPIVTATESFELSKNEVWQGAKFKTFDDKFVFQIDSGMLSSAGTLKLKEMILPPGSNMAPPQGFQLASRIYEFDWQAQKPEIRAKALWFSVKYDSADYFRKNIYYFDQGKNQWVGLPGIISNYYNKIIATFPLPYARIAILEDVDIMTDGVASWYKYKGCDCAASPDYPKGTKLKVTNTDNDKSVIVTINDWGPDRSVFPDRVIDLDAVAFKKIGSTRSGLIKVKVEPLDQVGISTND